jgi:hypothetical protein
MNLEASVVTTGPYILNLERSGLTLETYALTL